jgi:hypothetical protein
MSKYRIKPARIGESMNFWMPQKRVLFWWENLHYDSVSIETAQRIIEHDATPPIDPFSNEGAKRLEPPQ